MVSLFHQVQSTSLHLSAIHLEVPHPPRRVYTKMAQTPSSRVKRGSSWTGPCRVCPRCQLEDALIRTGRRASVQFQARWCFLHYGEDDMEVMKGELNLSPDNILWKSYFSIKANWGRNACTKDVLISKYSLRDGLLGRAGAYAHLISYNMSDTWLFSWCSCCGAYDVRKTEWPSAGVLSTMPVQTPWIETYYPLPVYWGSRKMCADLISSWMRRSSDLTYVKRKWLLGEQLAIKYSVIYELVINQGRLLDAP